MTTATFETADLVKEILGRDEDGDPIEQGTVTLDVFVDKLHAKIRERVEHPVMYDLGAGQRPEEGLVGLDLFSNHEGIKRCDLYQEPWTVDGIPIPDNSVDYLSSSHFVEHVPDWNQHFREVQRVLKPYGVYRIVAPYYTSTRYFQDPDHKQPISEARFLYLNHKWMEANGIEHGRDRFNLLPLMIFYGWNADWIDKSPVAQEYAKNHYWNVVDDIVVVLQKIPFSEELETPDDVMD